MSCTDYAKILGAWPNCVVPDCEHKACLHLNSDKCWPHTVVLQPMNCHDGMTDDEIEAFNEQAEAENGRARRGR